MQGGAADERDLPTPTEIIDAVLYWLRHWWDAPREKSKAADWTMVGLTVLVAGAAIVTALIFQAQLSLMRDADRPWIDLDVSIDSPLTYDNTGVRIGFNISPKNVGRSPAQNIWISPTLTPAFMGDDLSEIQKRICENARPSHEGLLSYLLFPGNHYTQPVGLDLSATAISSHWGKLPPNMEPPDPIPLALVGCIDYTYEASSRHHQTGFALDVVMKGGLLPLKSKTPIASEDLVLRAHSFGGHFAN
jgi:hypothetical protein